MSDTAYVLVTGSRQERNSVRIKLGLELAHTFLTIESRRLHIANGRKPFKQVCLIHGDEPKGLDRAAAKIAEESFGWLTAPFPAQWEDDNGKKNMGAGIERNGDMVNILRDLIAQGNLGICVAFPRIGSTGTWDCAKQSSVRAKILTVITPAI